LIVVEIFVVFPQRLDVVLESLLLVSLKDFLAGNRGQVKVRPRCGRRYTFYQACAGDGFSWQDITPLL
jgi:hypothetical protein